MSLLEDAVAAAIAAGANTLHVVPDQKATYVRTGNGSHMKNWRNLPNAQGSSLMSEIKRVCNMAVRKDIEQAGEGVVYTAGRRVIVRATTAPYRGDAERATLRINPG